MASGPLGFVDFSCSRGDCITNIQCQNEEWIEVRSSVYLGSYSTSPPRSKEKRQTGLSAFILIINNAKCAALVDIQTGQYHYLQLIKRLRCYMHAFQYARKHRIPVSCEVYAEGPKNSEIWTCRLLMGDRYYMGIGLMKQDAKDEAALRALLAFGVDIRGFA
ncbi:hypothetical protein FRC02_006306 [Tulasnella sp. 418]|nr:hypothetical protein FRC02_006306 [Tulasnella sp. 418]